MTNGMARLPDFVAASAREARSKLPALQAFVIGPAALAGILGALFLIEAYRLFSQARGGVSGAALKPMRLFHWSNTYLALLFVAVAVDPLLH